MKNSIITKIIPALLLVSAAFAQGEPGKDVKVRIKKEGGPGPHLRANLDDERGPVEKEKVAFLGVDTSPVDPALAAQLGLARETGLVVRGIVPDSAAEAVLKKHDVLTKLGDQILIDMHQLGVLVRNQKAGDEVKLTVIRDGKETVVKAKLGEREVPKLAGAFGMPGFGGGPGGNFFFQQGGPGMQFPEGPEAGDVMRMIGGDRMRWFAQPRVHVLRHKGEKGSTVLDLPSGSFVFSDDDGSVEISSNNDQRELTVKDKKGAVTYQGSLNTPEDQSKLPADVVERLKVIGGAELGDDDADLEIETKMLPPATKTQRPLPGRAPEAGMRTL